MAKQAKQYFLSQLRERVGQLRSLPNSQSLLESADGRLRLYLRYSKLHAGHRTFYGLRRQDLLKLQGHRSFICFIWDDQTEPLILPYEKYEDLFQTISPAPDGQYKTQVILHPDGVELYVAGGGRFNVESYLGWKELQQANEHTETACPELTHSQVQTLLGAIGSAKGFHIWIPQNDRGSLDWKNVPKFEMTNVLPSAYENVREIAEQVDVLWVVKGGGLIQALYEVEHSTTIYSGLLRFNDIHLATPSLQARFSIVAEDVRRGRFSRQLNRPTFQASGLHDLCGFLEYAEVYGWYKRLSSVPIERSSRYEAE